jgi:Ca2+-transporting ATPase
LAVTLALAFATKRMTKENLLVRVLGSCETMANATVICTDKTGTLTQNEMTVVAGSVGIHAKFVLRLQQNLARTNAEEEEASGSQSRVRKHPDDFSIDQTDLSRVLSPPLRKLFNEAIAINSTAFEDRDQNGQLVIIGNKTETALLNFVRQLGWHDFKQTRDSANVVQMIPFSSERKAMGVVVKMSNNRWRLYVKGASEIMTKQCRSHVVVHQDGNHRGSEDGEVETAPITEVEGDNISRTIIFYANQTLRTIAICYRDFDTWPPRHVQYNSPEEVSSHFVSR